MNQEAFEAWNACRSHRLQLCRIAAHHAAPCGPVHPRLSLRALRAWLPTPYTSWFQARSSAACQRAVVTPPAAAARVAVEKPSHSVRPGSLMCTCESTSPGRIDHIGPQSCSAPSCGKSLHSRTPMQSGHAPPRASPAPVPAASVHGLIGKPVPYCVYFRRSGRLRASSNATSAKSGVPAPRHRSRHPERGVRQGRPVCRCHCSRRPNRRRGRQHRHRRPTTQRLTVRSTPFAPPARRWAPSHSPAANSTPVANPAPCAWPRPTGRASMRSTTDAAPPMPRVPASTTPFSTTNSARIGPRARLPLDAASRRRGLGQLCRMDRFAQQGEVLTILAESRPVASIATVAKQTHCPTRVHALTSKYSHCLRWEWAQHAPSGSMFHHPGLQRRARPPSRWLSKRRP